MEASEIIGTWLKTFGKEVEESILKEHIYELGNFMWHIFTWGNVSCLEGEQAREAFNQLDYCDAIRFEGGYAVDDHRIEISNIDRTRKLAAKELDEIQDIYIVDDAFTWTYVHTHEGELGPYFLKKV